MNVNVNLVAASLRDLTTRQGACLTPVEKSQFAATIIGAAIGSTLYLPSAPVDIPRNFFLTTHGEKVSCILGCINESYPLNFDLAMSIASNVFLSRYRLVFEPAFTVHALIHLAGCSDDVVPTTIKDILNKTHNVEDAFGLQHVTNSLVAALNSGEQLL